MNRTHKYNAKRVTIDGLHFDSTAEGARYCELKLLERVGQIHGLKVHPRYEIIVNGNLICRYIGDFLYTEKGREILEDVKGVRTPEFKIKSKLMLACHGITVLETGARK